MIYMLAYTGQKDYLSMIEELLSGPANKGTENSICSLILATPKVVVR